MNKNQNNNNIKNNTKNNNMTNTNHGGKPAETESRTVGYESITDKIAEIEASDLNLDVKKKLIFNIENGVTIDVDISELKGADIEKYNELASKLRPYDSTQTGYSLKWDGWTDSMIKKWLTPKCVMPNTHAFYAKPMKRYDLTEVAEIIKNNDLQKELNTNLIKRPERKLVSKKSALTAKINKLKAKLEETDNLIKIEKQMEILFENLEGHDYSVSYRYDNHQGLEIEPEIFLDDKNVVKDIYERDGKLNCDMSDLCTIVMFDGDEAAKALSDFIEHLNKSQVKGKEQILENTVSRFNYWKKYHSKKEPEYVNVEDYFQI